MSLPKVSWICATYNRAPYFLRLVDEAVESYRRNAELYGGESEMVLLNDCPGQTLVCERPPPGLRIVNHPTRFDSLGEKLNAAIELATGSVIIPADDDDISLPNRASILVEKLGTLDYFKSIGYFFQDRDGWHTTHSMGVCHNCSVFTKDAWERALKYPAISGAQDAALDARLRQLHWSKGDWAQRPEFWTYIYRWSVSPVHLSGVMPHDDFYRHVGTLPVATGTFQLTSSWSDDYPERCRAACARHPSR